jgi:hypothetical protein
LGCLFEIDNWPGWITVLGGAVSLGGILIITLGGFELEKLEETSKGKYVIGIEMEKKLVEDS